MSYFEKFKDKFILEPKNSAGLRNCQLGAVWALKSYYTTTDNKVAALISMPTGAGKTAIMMATCFELNIRKALIVVPSQLLRRQLCEKFSNLQILKDVGCFDKDTPKVKVYEVIHRKKEREEWEEWEDILSEHDIIIAHPNGISPYYKNLEPIPKDLIDIVFIDEAHHEPAPTWKSINNYYDLNKRVFLTATPFRRDRKRMQAKLVYHYPLEIALRENIIKKINYIGEHMGVRGYDEALIESAKTVLAKMRALMNNVALLIRTDSIPNAKKLVNKYNTEGIKVDTIHSDRKNSVNDEIINKVKNNELDGIVCVDSIGEGIDIPIFKIGVMHRTQKSIPYTIQFLGRISRQDEQKEQYATLIANKSEVRGEINRLYKTDKSWELLIPEVIDSEIKKARYYKSTYSVINNFSMPEINVFFSSIIYKVPTGFEFANEGIEPAPPYSIIHIEQDSDDDPLVVITSYDKPIEWAKRQLYIEDNYDIHIFYHIKDKRLLFELTTSEIVLKSFKNLLITSEIEKLSYNKLYKAISSNYADYIMIGMKNATLHGTAQPSYKTIMGSSVNSTIRPSEGRIFGTGHALVNIGTDDTWGISTKKSRVWSIQRGTVHEFKNWCDQLAELITEGNPANSLPGLSFLAKTISVDKYKKLPLAIVLDDFIFKSDLVEIYVDGTVYMNIIPIIVPKSIDVIQNTILCEVSISTETFDIQACLDNSDIWRNKSDKIVQLKFDKGTTSNQYSFCQFLNIYNPSLIMSDGSIIEGKNKIIPNTSIEILPDEIWKKRLWDNCNIKAERYDAIATTNLPVINKTIELIKANYDSGIDIIILDDGSNEIADIIGIKKSSNEIYLIHCKASSKTTPGVRKIDGDILFTQVLRSIHWIYNNKLFKRISERLKNNSKIVFGNQTVYDTIKKEFEINEWDYIILAVQPGFDIDKIKDNNRKNNNNYELAIPMYERVISSNARIEIWGS